MTIHYKNQNMYLPLNNKVVILTWEEETINTSLTSVSLTYRCFMIGSYRLQ